MLILGLTAACGSVEQITGQEPIVDMRGVNVTAYQADLWECQSYANDVALGRQVMVATAGGAAVGAVVGAAVGNSDTAKQVAGVGAASGALHGVKDGLHERRMVIRNCLNGRGYRVLN